MSREMIVHGAREDVLVSGAGDPYAILTAVPDEAPPAGGYPVLYLLDGGASFGTLVEMVRQRRNRPAMTAVEAAIVVGIAHPGAYPYDRARRRMDYTPEPAGRSGAFLDFLTGELHPWMEERYEVHAGRRVLLGHSLAGAFVLETLAARPESHRGFVALSPSIWAARERLRDGLAAIGPRLERAGEHHPRRLMVAVGQYDQEIAPWQRHAPNQAKLRARREERAMVDNARAYCERLRRQAGPHVEVRFDVCKGEDHASILPVGLSRSLRFVAGVARSGAGGARPTA